MARRAFALPIVVAVIAVLGILIMMVSRYQASRIKATGEQVSAYSALEAAQAGLHVALAEMKLTPLWATHRMELQPATGAFRWTDALQRTLKSSGDPSGTGLLKIDSSSDGALSGSIGSGVFTAKFKVKVGRLPIADDPNTRAVDESARYWRIESIGLKTERGKVRDRATRLDVIVERTNFTEYVLYDGEDIVFGLGSSNDHDNVNLISDGWLFGRNFVHLGNIIPDGTRLEFASMGKILSDGPIRAWDAYDVPFQDPKGLRVNLNPGNDSSAGDASETAAGNILDGNHRKSAGFMTLDENYYRQLAKHGGIDVSNRPTREDRLAMFPENPKIQLNFGQAGYTDENGKPTSGLQPDDAKALGQEYPKDFNGLIFSDKPLAVWGCPDRDVTIFCTKDVFVCGDFNARVFWKKDANGNMNWLAHHQNYAQRYQPPGQAPVEGSRYVEYRPEDRDIYTEPEDPTQRVQDGTEDRKAVAIITMGRVWMDARRPSRFLANELKPYIKFKIMEALSDATNAYDACRTDTHNVSATDLSLKYNGVLSTKLQELFDVRRKVSARDARNKLYLTPESYETVSKAFVDVLVTKAGSVEERGLLTRQQLEGTTISPGLVDVVMDAMAADEDRAREFTTAGAEDDISDLAIWNAPQALYDMVCDERGALGPQGYGPYSDWGGDPARSEFQRDELMMPQMTVNAMLISSAARNDPDRSTNPTASNRRLEQLGDGRKSPHYLSTQAYRQNGDKNAIIAPFILRLLGSQVRLANVKNYPPVFEPDWYWPPIRRWLYDPALPFHPPPHLPSQLEIVSFKQRGATTQDYTSFDSGN